MKKIIKNKIKNKKLKLKNVTTIFLELILSNWLLLTNIDEKNIFKWCI